MTPEAGQSSLSCCLKFLSRWPKGRTGLFLAEPHLTFVTLQMALGPPSGTVYTNPTTEPRGEPS